jgi:hypothetical protein
MSRFMIGRQCRRACLFALVVAGLTAGCGDNGPPDGTMVTSDPKKNQRTKEMFEYMKGQPETKPDFKPKSEFSGKLR